jgi:hypothetical protein
MLTGRTAVTGALNSALILGYAPSLGLRQCVPVTYRNQARP